jgi:hypothetical protein
LYFPSVPIPIGDELPPGVDTRAREVVESLEEAADRARTSAKHLTIELAEEHVNNFLVECVAQHKPGLILYWGMCRLHQLVRATQLSTDTPHTPHIHTLSHTHSQKGETTAPSWYNQAAHFYHDFFRFGVMLQPSPEVRMKHIYATCCAETIY